MGGWERERKMSWEKNNHKHCWTKYGQMLHVAALAHSRSLALIPSMRPFAITVRSQLTGTLQQQQQQQPKSEKLFTEAQKFYIPFEVSVSGCGECTVYLYTFIQLGHQTFKHYRTVGIFLACVRLLWGFCLSYESAVHKHTVHWAAEAVAFFGVFTI